MEHQPPTTANYPVHRAAIETVAAIRANWVTYVVSILVTGVVGAISGVVLLAGIIAAAAGLALAKSANPGALIGLGIGAVLLITVWYAFAGAFVLSNTALALDAGASGRRSGVGETLRESFRRMKRVVLAQILMVIVAIWPLVAGFLVGAFSIHFGRGSGRVIAFLLPIAGIVWLYITLLRFVLVPYVALFEPEVPIRQVLSRSSQLMRKGGQWFVVKGLAALLLITFGVSALLPPVKDQAMYASNPAASLFLFILSLLASGAVVMLYRNRKIAKG